MRSIALHPQGTLRHQQIAPECELDSGHHNVRDRIQPFCMSLSAITGLAYNPFKFDGPTLFVRIIIHRHTHTNTHSHIYTSSSKTEQCANPDLTNGKLALVQSAKINGMRQQFAAAYWCDRKWTGIIKIRLFICCIHSVRSLAEYKTSGAFESTC